MKAPSIFVGTILVLAFFSSRIGAGALLPDPVHVPLTVLHGRLYVRAALQGQAQPNWWLVDTGSRRSVIDWKIKETNQIPVRPSGTLHFVLTAGLLQTSNGDLQNLKIGLLDVSKKYVQFARLTISLLGFSHPFGGIIGGDLLWDHQAILDIGERTLYLK